MTSSDPSPLNAHAATDAAARRSYGKLVALLASRTGDIAAAEDALSDAFVAALEHWPRDGCPANPEAWLLTVAKRNAIDTGRKDRTHAAAIEELHRGAAMSESTTEPPAIPDHRLGLMFACAHPAIDAGVRAPLMLQTVLGFNAATIASAFLLSPATMSQRLVRAKTKIKEAAVPFRVPGHEELAARLDGVLDAIYAAFAEGWTDAAGTDAARRELAGEAIFLGTLLTELLPEEPETLGLLALMLYAQSRRRARRNAQGEYVPLGEQDTELWDSKMIASAESFLARASKMRRIGRFQLEAAIQSAHTERCKTGINNWSAIVQLYDALFSLSQSPVVAINRALALSEIEGADAALRAMEKIASDPRLQQYQPYWAARAKLLAKAGRTSEAFDAYDLAIGLERDPAVRDFLQRRQSHLND